MNKRTSSTRLSWISIPMAAIGVMNKLKEMALWAPQIFTGSADWRYRNMNERVEAIVPITLPKIKKRIVHILSNALHDNRLAWEMHADGSYSQRQPGNDEERNFHDLMMADARRRAFE